VINFETCSVLKYEKKGEKKEERIGKGRGRGRGGGKEGKGRGRGGEKAVKKRLGISDRKDEVEVKVESRRR